ncbi:hypothetical protein [Sporomusa silvacetica]|uniref:hypothetical protein n=1 Tax=Sporomusa silvacetica TaxID=55504 RepID=UPI00146BDE79|nr:hypothetical protein [Sporomusa silvacetica]
MTAIVVAKTVAKMNNNAPKHYMVTTIKYSNAKTFEEAKGRSSCFVFKTRS